MIRCHAGMSVFIHCNKSRVTEKADQTLRSTSCILAVLQGSISITRFWPMYLHYQGALNLYFSSPTESRTNHIRNILVSDQLQVRLWF